MNLANVQNSEVVSKERPSDTQCVRRSYDKCLTNEEENDGNDELQVQRLVVGEDGNRGLVGEGVVVAVLAPTSE